MRISHSLVTKALYAMATQPSVAVIVCPHECAWASCVCVCVCVFSRAGVHGRLACVRGRLVCVRARRVRAFTIVRVCTSRVRAAYSSQDHERFGPQVQFRPLH